MPAAVLGPWQTVTAPATPANHQSAREYGCEWSAGVDSSVTFAYSTPTSQLSANVARSRGSTEPDSSRSDP